MGGSGAGKTTLMDVIAGRKTVGDVQGSIMVNGHPKDQRSWSRVVGYVEQADVHSPGATVEEALWFSARLRLPQSVSDEQVRVQSLQSWPCQGPVGRIECQGTARHYLYQFTRLCRAISYACTHMSW